MSEASKARGADGQDGSDGQDGVNGTDGLNVLVKTTDEAAGSSCANGGLKIEVGGDDDGDGLLSSSEVIERSTCVTVHTVTTGQMV